MRYLLDTIRRNPPKTSQTAFWRFMNGAAVVVGLVAAAIGIAVSIKALLAVAAAAGLPDLVANSVQPDPPAPSPTTSPTTDAPSHLAPDQARLLSYLQRLPDSEQEARRTERAAPEEPEEAKVGLDEEDLPRNPLRHGPHPPVWHGPRL